MAAGNPTANLAQALATIANAFALNQSGPNVAPTQSTSVATSVSQAGSSSTANASADGSSTRPTSSRYVRC